MAECARSHILPSNATDSGSHTGRVLQRTSGNVQIFAQGVKQEGENEPILERPLTGEYPCSKASGSQLLHAPTVGSNECSFKIQHHGSKRHRLRHHNVEPQKFFWQHQRYKDYRGRQERGKLKDSNDEVWPDRVERAFCDGEYSHACFEAH